ncbi:MAG: hypothetical protein WCR98_07505, partial [Saccharofermentanales bacterium]
MILFILNNLFAPISDSLFAIGAQSFGFCKVVQASCLFIGEAGWKPVLHCLPKLDKLAAAPCQTSPISLAIFMVMTIPLDSVTRVSES